MKKNHNRSGREARSNRKQKQSRAGARKGAEPAQASPAARAKAGADDKVTIQITDEQGREWARVPFTRLEHSALTAVCRLRGCTMKQLFEEAVTAELGSPGPGKLHRRRRLGATAAIPDDLFGRMYRVLGKDGDEMEFIRAIIENAVVELERRKTATPSGPASEAARPALALTLETEVHEATALVLLFGVGLGDRFRQCDGVNALGGSIDTGLVSLSHKLAADIETSWDQDRKSVV